MHICMWSALEHAEQQGVQGQHAAQQMPGVLTCACLLLCFGICFARCVLRDWSSNTTGTCTLVALSLLTVSLLYACIK